MAESVRAVPPEALSAAAAAAFPVGEFVGQQSFMRASEVRGLAERAGIGPGTAVLDLCCGIAGPGRLITAEFGCAYLGVDESSDALDVARTLAARLACRFELRRVPPLPDGTYDVVLLLETLLAFPDKHALFADIARALTPNGRFALTVEEGRPLSAPERHLMPHAETVWPIELGDLVSVLHDVGLAVTWRHDYTAAHLEVALALLDSYRGHADEIAAKIGPRGLADLIAAHELWCDWMGSARIRKFALVATKV